MTTREPQHNPEENPDFDWTRAEADDLDTDTSADIDAEVLDFPAGGKARRANLDAVPDEDDEDDDDSEDASDSEDDAGRESGADRESVEMEQETVGGQVDPSDEVPLEVSRAGRERRPIIPAWAKSWTDLKAAFWGAVKDASYVTRFHAVRAPLYAVKTGWYALLGAGGTARKAVVWASAEEGNWQLRQHAATTNDREGWLKLEKVRASASRPRWFALLAAVTGIMIAALIVIYGPVPFLVQAVLVAGVVLVLARLGRPVDKRITDRVSEKPRYRKLTADLVRRGLMNVGLSGITKAVAKDPGAISFPTEIHRDGPGHMAIVDLPYGVIAADVIARRDKLASGLRLPLDQVWPETDRTHTGRLALWVGHQPASQMTPPKWPLLSGEQVDIFKPVPFATDPRLRITEAEYIARNWLFGGQPGSGKTFALRLLVLAAALDPRVELRGYELKGVGDFAVVEPVCTEYGNGFDDDTIERCAAMVDWLYAECERRSERIAFYAAKGKAPQNKVTPELASLKKSGLHPLVVFIDEVQELFQHPEFGKRAGEIMEKAIKLGRAMGVTVLLGTQIPDKNSLPPGITRNVNTRFCLSVMDQIANDMILGTSMYQNGNRATVFEPGTDAGWGIAVGLGKIGARKSFYVDTDAAKPVIAKAIGYRTEAGTMPTKGDQKRDTGPSFDLLADLITVWPTGEDKAWNETLIERLADLRPEVYAKWKQDQLTAALDNHDIKVGQIGRRVNGKTVNRRGPARDHITEAIAERNRRRASE